MSSGPELHFVSFRKTIATGLPLINRSSSCVLAKAQWMTTDIDANDLLNNDPPNTTNWGRVLIVIHGFNINKNGFEEDFDRLVGRIKQLPAASQYTHVVGILWPAEAHLVKYDAAKANAKTLAQNNSAYEFRATLIKICECSQRGRSGVVDVFVHSLGNYLLFEALKEQCEIVYRSTTPVQLRYIFSCAAAVNNDSVETSYSQALQVLCTQLFVFFSREDSVLEFGYPAEEWHLALGCTGAASLDKTPTTYTQIDCTDYIHGHSEYWTSEDIYAILARLLGLRILPTQKTFTAQQILHRPARQKSFSLWKPLLIVFAILAIFGFLYTRATPKFDNRA